MRFSFGLISNCRKLQENFFVGSLNLFEMEVMVAYEESIEDKSAVVELTLIAPYFLTDVCASQNWTLRERLVSAKKSFNKAPWKIGIKGFLLLGHFAF